MNTVSAPHTATPADMGPLAWLLDQISDNLQSARTTLRRIVQQRVEVQDRLPGADAAALRGARTQVHQAGGAVELLGYFGAARLMQAAETALDRLIDHPAEFGDDALRTFEAAFNALVDYLESQRAGKNEPALKLYPEYRDLMALARAERIHPADLWDHDWTWPQVPPSTSPTPLQTEDRALLERALLAVMRGQDLSEAAHTLNTVAQRAQQASVGQTASLWWLARGVFEGLGAGLLQPDADIKRLINRLNLQLRTQLQGQSPAPQRLGHDLAFFCAQALHGASQARAPIPHLRAIDDTLHLGDTAFADYQRSHFGLIDPARVQQVRKRVQTLRDGWSNLAGHAQVHIDPARIGKLVELADSLRAPLKELVPGSEALPAALADLFRGFAGKPDLLSPERALDAATAILFLDLNFSHFRPEEQQFLDRSQQLAERLRRSTAGEVATPLDAWMEELFRQSSESQTMGSVVHELRTDMNAVEKVLDGFFRDPTQRADLDQVPHLLQQMRGVFSVLGVDVASDALAHVRDTVEGLVDNPGTPDQQTFDTLAGNIGALGFLVDMLAYQPELAKSLFVFDADRGELRAVVLATQRTAPPTHREDLERTAQTLVDDVAAGLPDELAAQRLATLKAEASLANLPEIADRAEQRIAELQAPTAPTAEVPPEPVAEAAPAEPAPAATPAPSEEPAEQDDGMDELTAIFLEEAREVITNARETDARLRVHPHDDDAMASLRRAFHTLKGSSRMVGLQAYGEAAWALEQVFNLHLASQAPADTALLDLASEALSRLSTWAEAIAAGDTTRDDSAAIIALAARYGQAGSEELPAAEASPPAAAEIAEAPPVVEPSAPTFEPAPVIEPAEPVVEPAPAFESQMFPPLGEQPQPEQPEPLLPDLGDQALDDLLLGRVLADHTAAQAPAPTAEAAEFPELTDVPPLAAAPPAAPLDLGNLLDGIDLELPPAQAEPEHTETFTPAAEAFEAAPQPVAPEPVEPVPTEAFAPPAAPFEAAPQPFVSEPPAPEPVEAFAPPAEPFEAAPQAFAPEPVAPEPVEAFAPPAEPFEAAPQPFSSEIEDIKIIGDLRIPGPLYNIYLSEADDLSRRLDTALRDWLAAPTPEHADDAAELAHKLAGSSATVGLRPVADLAAQVEHTLEALGPLPEAVLPASRHAVFDAASSDIKQLLHQFAGGFLKDAPDVTRAQLAALTDAAAELAADTFATSGPDGQQSSGQEAPLAADALVDAIDPDLFPIFEDEANELLPELAAALRRWEAQPASHANAATAAMRILHTLKGSARMAGAMRLGDMAHQLESDIDNLVVGDSAATEGELGELLGRFDQISARFERLREAAERGDSVLAELTAPTPAPQPTPEAVATVAAQVSPQAEHDHLAAAATAALQARTLAVPRMGGQPVRVRAHLLDRLVNQAGEISISRARLEAEVASMRTSVRDLGENLDRLRHQVREIEIQAEAQMSAQVQAARDAHRDFDPLEFDRYTRTQELTRMMAESVNDVALVQATLGRLMRDVDDDMARQSRQTRDLQRDLLRTRMVEFDSLAERLYRTVRQAGKDLGKQVRLDIAGGTIEIDRGVLDRMAGSFDHLLRNAVAHGIESPEARVAAGKPAVGTVTLQVRQEGNEVAIEISDDGRGLDYAAIRAKGERLGLIDPAASVSNDDLAALVFRPNFSSAEQTTEVAGRGVGLDVVRNEVANLGGQVQLDNPPGSGARFTLLLPLTTAITQVVLLKLGGSEAAPRAAAAAGRLPTALQTVAVPANLVELVLRLKPEQIDAAARSMTVQYNGENLPFYWMGALLGYSGASSQPLGKSVPVVVIRSANQRVAVQVDDVLGNQEVVVKNLGPQLSRVPGLAGISVLPSGDASLIYNPVALAAVYGESAGALMHAPPAPAPAEDAAATESGQTAGSTALIMVVDDSITVRRVTQRFLARHGYTVQLAKDGLDALEQLQQSSTLPDVILLDIEMPRMDGFDLTRNIRADGRLKQLPIIMITSRIAEKHRNYAAELGVNHYLGKPYSETELLRLIGEFTTHHAARQH